MRDDFPIKIKETLAKRVGNICSNPTCGHSTSGPQENPEKSINVGVAAHITGASPGGPRFDSNLTSRKRQSIENGIWLCQTCAKLIDSDEKRYTVEVLRKWKTEAEETARIRLEGKTNHEKKDTTTDFIKLEKMMPDLLDEMRADLEDNPVCREFEA